MNCRLLALLSALWMSTLVAVPMSAQNPPQPPVETDPAMKELQSRLLAAAQAQQSGDPEAVDQTSRGVIAFGLRQMGSLRAMEGLIPSAVGLFKQSLAYEDVPGLHLQLALAYARAGAVEDGLKETHRLVEAEPKNGSAWNLQGRLCMVKKDYQCAVDSFEKSLAM